MAYETPADWLPYLAQKLDARASHVARMRSYVNGEAPLPEMGRNTRATWIAFQRKARTNFGGIACQSHANRIIARGVRVGSDDQSEASLAARRIWRDNRMPMQIADAVWDMLVTRTGYLVAGIDEDGKALLTAEKPEFFYAEPDPVRPWRSRAAIKVWRDGIEKRDYALVWAGGVRQRFQREQVDNGVLLSSMMGGWVDTGETFTYGGNPPVFILDRRDGLGLIEPHVHLLDRINLGKLQRLSVTAMQAFRQRALKRGPDAPPLPEKDENGKVIDYGKVFEPAPGALWELPAGIDIWESTPADLTGLLAGETADARELSAVTGTPVSMLMPDGANQSAQGATNTTAQQVDACRSDIDRIKLAAAAVILAGLRGEGIDFGDETVEVDFLDPAWVTLAEQMDALSKAVAAGMSLAMAQKMYLGWTQEQIDEDDRNRRRIQARETLSALAGAAVAPVVTSGVGG